MNADAGRTYLRAMAIFWLGFGLITTLFPRLMELFMSERGRDASTAFSDQVWLHGGLDIISVTVLLFVLSTLHPSAPILRGAATVALLPTAAILYTLVATPFWTPLFLLPAAGCLGFAVWGFTLSRSQGSEAAASAAAGP